MSGRRKITVVGAGNVGATCAQVLAMRDYADVVLVDIKEGLPQGKALDVNQMGKLLGYEPNVVGSNSYEESAGSSVVVITAGLPRGPGMSRDDLVATNEKIVKDVTEKVVAASPDAVLIVVSNPLDAMCHVAKNVSGWPRERVVGMAGILDTARFATFIAWETGSSMKDVTALVLGGHGDQMVPVVSATSVGGVPLRRLVGEERIGALVERTAKGGGELVELLGTSAWYAPGAAAAPGAYQAEVPSSWTTSPPPLAVRSTIAWMRSSATSLRIGTPPTVVAEITETIWSPWPPSTTALTSFTDDRVSQAMNVWSRAVSRMPAWPNTRSFGNPETLFAT